jgi:hypothetical protein
MKRTLITLALAFGSAVAVLAQGQIVFTTFGSGVAAPATNAVTMSAAGGATYLAQLFYGTPGQTEDQFVPLTNAPARFNAGGYVTSSSGGGTRFIGFVGEAQFQVRAWSAALGDNFNSAFTAWQASAPSADAVLGRSKIVTVNALAVPAPPPALTGLTGYMLLPVPEPSVLALVGVGLLGLLIRRRK